MKLIQLNLWQGRLLRNAVKLFEAQKPDIICLQEVPSSNIKQDGFLNINSFEKLKELVDLPNYYYSPRFSYSIMHGRSLYGNCILSRFPIKNQQTRFTVREFVDDIMLSNENHDMVNVQLAVLYINGRPLNILNHHGYHQIDPDGNQTSIDSLQKVSDWVKEIPGPIILAGDLNVWPSSPAIQSLNSLLRNLPVENKIHTTLNDLGAVNNVLCDYIMVNQEINVRQFEVLDEMVSDHKALILEFDI